MGSHEDEKSSHGSTERLRLFEALKFKDSYIWLSSVAYFGVVVLACCNVVGVLRLDREDDGSSRLSIRGDIKSRLGEKLRLKMGRGAVDTGL